MSTRPPGTDDPLLALAELPGVADAVQAARQACDELRWHRAMRRRAAQARVEAAVQAARASAALEGARLPTELVRDAMRGAAELPRDGAGAVVRGAVRAVAEAEHLAEAGGRQLTAAPWQALAALHVAAAADLVDASSLGRPRAVGEQPVDDTLLAGVPAPEGAELSARLEALGHLLSTPTTAPVMVLAAVAQAEILVLRPFVAANAVVARALARAIVTGRGLDPMGVAVPELALLVDPQGPGRPLGGYLSGRADGVGGWLVFAASTMVAGAQQGAVIADAVLAGRLPAQRQR